MIGRKISWTLLAGVWIGVTWILLSWRELSNIIEQASDPLVFEHQPLDETRVVEADKESLDEGISNVPQFDNKFIEEHRKIDEASITERCNRYGLEPFYGPVRKIFFGAIVADDNWEVFQMHAAEAYDIYHVAVFVESNTTHVASPRTLRFKDSEEGRRLRHSGMFGPSTKVFVDFWLEDWPDLKWMDRESEQRNAVIERWAAAGMMPEDVGIMADADEFFSRDFLRALQTCDFPALRPDPSCHRPKVSPLSISFEMSPYCIKQKEWFHPDAIRGECVFGIGDPSERLVPLRTHNRRFGERHESYGKDDIDEYPEAAKDSNRYPLFTGPDIRVVQGDWDNPYTFNETPGAGVTAVYGVGYHFHNWFADMNTLRHKYATYAHGLRRTMMKPLQIVGWDLDIPVRCVRGIDNDANPSDWAEAYYLNGKSIMGPRPIYFSNKTYLEERHKLVREMIRNDEAKYGSCYDSDDRWIKSCEEKTKDAASQSTKATGTEAITENAKKSSKQLAKKSSKQLTKKSSKQLAKKSSKQLAKKSSKQLAKKVVEKLYTDRNSSTATVMGMASNLQQMEILRFVLSLRKTGFQGHIILGVEAHADENFIDRLIGQGVTPKMITFSNCTFEPFKRTVEEDTDPEVLNRVTVCVEPYLGIKGRWAKYPLGRDWLLNCSTCTGPVLITDVRDAFFQRDPFGSDTPEVVGLQVYEEHPNVTTEHWLVDSPVGDCKGKHFKKPMLCSGTTIGTREAMISYLDTMYDEMKRWISDPKCRFPYIYDDQSIHNWLFYSGALKNAVAVKHREGVVHTVGFEGSQILDANEKRVKQEGITDGIHLQPLLGASSDTWISTDFGLTNANGEFTNFDGTVSPIVHQYDRLGFTLDAWIDKLVNLDE